MDTQPTHDIQTGIPHLDQKIDHIHKTIGRNMRLFLDTSGEISPKNIAKYKGQALSRISRHTRKAISTTIKQVHTQLQYYQDIQTKLRMSGISECQNFLQNLGRDFFLNATIVTIMLEKFESLPQCISFLDLHQNHASLHTSHISLLLSKCSTFQQGEQVIKTYAKDQSLTHHHLLQLFQIIIQDHSIISSQKKDLLQDLFTLLNKRGLNDEQSKRIFHETLGKAPHYLREYLRLFISQKHLTQLYPLLLSDMIVKPYEIGDMLFEDDVEWNS